MAPEEKPTTSQSTEVSIRKDRTTVEDELDEINDGPTAAWKHIVTDLADNTGMHGLSNIRRHGSIVKKLFWIIVLLTSLGFGVWQITLCIQKLMSLPTETEIKEEFGSKRDFPAVSFCNINPMRYSEVASLADFSTYYANQANASSPKNFTDLNTNGEDNYDENQEDIEEADFLFEYAKLSATERRDVGHQLKSMLLGCSYNKKSCTSSNFSTFLDPIYGNCFTFNNGYNGTAIKPMAKSGPRNALQISLFINQDEYVLAASKSAGIRVVIHSPDHMPIPEDEGFSIRPGTETYVAIKQVENHLTYPPYGPCQPITEAENLEKNAYALYDPARVISYSGKVCKMTCLQKAIMSTCNCYDPSYPHTGPAFASLGTNNYTLCNITDIAVDNCEYEVNENYTAGILDCESICPPACIETLYRRDISQTLWPSRVYEDNVLNDVYSLSEYLYDSLSQLTDVQRTAYLRENVLKFRVFFSTLDKTIVTTSPSYQVFQFLSDLGGQTGLWLGFSVMTFFEFVELFFDIIYLSIASAKMAAQKNSVQHILENPTT